MLLTSSISRDSRNVGIAIGISFILVILSATLPQFWLIVA